MQFLQLLKKKNVNILTPDDLRRYMVYAMEKQGIKENTAHSCRTRVSELVNLKMEDTDRDRMQIYIQPAKGKKDRYIGLPHTF